MVDVAPAVGDDFPFKLCRERPLRSPPPFPRRDWIRLRPEPSLRSLRLGFELGERLVTRGVPPVPPGQALANELLVERAPIGEDKIGDRAAIPVDGLWLDPDHLAEGKLGGRNLGQTPEVLPRLRAINRKEPNLYRGPLPKDSDGVTPSEMPTTFPENAWPQAAGTQAPSSQITKTQNSRPHWSRT